MYARRQLQALVRWHPSRSLEKEAQTERYEPCGGGLVAEVDVACFHEEPAPRSPKAETKVITDRRPARLAGRSDGRVCAEPPCGIEATWDPTQVPLATGADRPHIGGWRLRGTPAARTRWANLGEGGEAVVGALELRAERLAGGFKAERYPCQGPHSSDIEVAGISAQPSRESHAGVSTYSGNFDVAGVGALARVALRFESPRKPLSAQFESAYHRFTAFPQVCPTCPGCRCSPEAPPSDVWTVRASCQWHFRGVPSGLYASGGD